MPDRPSSRRAAVARLALQTAELEEVYKASKQQRRHMLEYTAQQWRSTVEAAVLVSAHLATTGSSDCVGRRGAALRTREERGLALRTTA